MKKIKLLKLMEIILCTFMLFILGWIFISFVEVVCNNLTPGHQYASWNFFTFMLELSK